MGIAPWEHVDCVGKAAWYEIRPIIYACPKYLRQTFHEFADHARKWCPWSQAYYRLQKSRGMKHHAALRKVALRWIRILFRVWKNREAYDPAAYMTTIKRKNPAIVPFLPPPQVEA